MLYVAGSGTLSDGGYLSMTSSVQAIFPRSSILSHIMLKGTFHVEDITVYYYTPVSGAYITRTYFRRVNATTRTVTQDPDDDTDHGNGASGNDNYVFTVDKTLDLNYYYQLKIDMLYVSGTDYINGFKLRGKFV